MTCVWKLKGFCWAGALGAARPSSGWTSSSALADMAKVEGTERKLVSPREAGRVESSWSRSWKSGEGGTIDGVFLLSMLRAIGSDGHLVVEQRRADEAMNKNNYNGRTAQRS